MEEGRRRISGIDRAQQTIIPSISKLLVLAFGALIASGVAGAILLARDQPRSEHDDPHLAQSPGA